MWTALVLASAAAWSPNPKNPPLYLDLPWRGGKFQPGFAAKWVANAPLAMIDQYIANLKRLRGIAFDAGTGDPMNADGLKVLDPSRTNSKSMTATT